MTSDVWVAEGVLPLDINNGLEDGSNTHWAYWDGKILQAPNGKYHLLGSRWAQSQGHGGQGHGGWWSSEAFHAVSDGVLGPYVDQGRAYSDRDGKGHNVNALALPDGRYAILVSETRPADIFP